jgi:hypothetical protein
LSLDRSTRVNHNFELINITMSGEGCFGGPLQQLLLPLGGVGPVVANDVMYGIGGSGGGVLKAAHGQSYYWRRPAATLLHEYQRLGSRQTVHYNHHLSVVLRALNYHCTAGAGAHLIWGCAALSSLLLSPGQTGDTSLVSARWYR